MSDVTDMDTDAMLDELVRRGVLDVDTFYDHRFMKTEEDLLRDGPGAHVGAMVTRRYSGERRSMRHGDGKR